MKLLVESIRNAVEKDCLIPALMSSLTIPDAMGQGSVEKVGVEPHPKRVGPAS